MSKKNTNANTRPKDINDAPQTDKWGHAIPDGTWNMDALGDYAQEQQRIIHGAETFVTPYYWRLGRALTLARKSLTKVQYKQFLAERGIHKVRASKARAIARFYKAPEDVATITVHDAYEAVLEDRRKRKKTDQEKLQEELDKDDADQADSDAAAISTTLTGKLAVVNDQLNRWADALAFDGLSDHDSSAQVTAEIEKAIATLGVMKEKLLAQNEQQTSKPINLNDVPGGFTVI